MIHLTNATYDVTLGQPGKLTLNFNVDADFEKAWIDVIKLNPFGKTEFGETTYTIPTLRQVLEILTEQSKPYCVYPEGRRGKLPQDERGWQPK